MNVEKRGALTTHQENFFDNIKKKGGVPEVSQGLRCEFQSNGVPVPEERCAHSNANGVAVPF